MNDYTGMLAFVIVTPSFIYLIFVYVFTGMLAVVILTSSFICLLALFL